MGKKIYLTFYILNLIFLSETFASHSVYPTHIKIEEHDQIGELNIVNRSDYHKNMQIILQKRTGPKTQTYKDTKDFITSPVICTVPPHDTQLIRLKIKDPKAKLNEFERGYKVIVKELPAQNIMTNASKVNLNMLVNFEVPLTINTKKVQYSKVTNILSK